MIVGGILYLLFVVLLVSFGAALDRIRGDKRGFNRLLEKLSLGFVMGLSLGPLLFMLTTEQLLWCLGIISIGYAVGSSPGWGGPFGAIIRGLKKTEKGDYEWYEKLFPFTQDNAWHSLVVRGIIWAVPCIPAAVMYGAWGPVAGIIIAFPLSLWLALEYTENGMFEDGTSEGYWLDNQWAWAELIRGGLAVLISCIISIVIWYIVPDMGLLVSEGGEINV